MSKKHVWILALFSLMSGVFPRAAPWRMADEPVPNSPPKARVREATSQGGSDVQGGFLSRLEEVLSSGLADQDPRAISACLALVFSDDTSVRTTALSAVGHRVAGQRVLERILGELKQNEHWKNDAGAKGRLIDLLGCSSTMDEPSAFMWLVVYHLDSKTPEVRLVSLGWLLEATSYLRAMLPKKGGPPIESMIRDVGDLGEITKAKQQWGAWFSQAEDKKVNAAVSKMFAELKKNNGKRKDEILREYLFPAGGGGKRE